MIMTTSREAVYVALMALIAAIPGIKTCTRKLKHWSDVANEDQPAIFLALGDETSVPTRGLPNKLTLTPSVWLYVNTGGAEVGPVLNPLLDKIEAALDATKLPGKVLTLGGLVHHCWIEGTTQIFEGNLGDEAVAIIPIHVLVS